MDILINLFKSDSNGAFGIILMGIVGLLFLYIILRIVLGGFSINSTSKRRFTAKTPNSKTDNIRIELNSGNLITLHKDGVCRQFSDSSIGKCGDDCVYQIVNYRYKHSVFTPFQEVTLFVFRKAGANLPYFRVVRKDSIFDAILENNLISTVKEKYFITNHIENDVDEEFAERCYLRGYRQDLPEIRRLFYTGSTSKVLAMIMNVGSFHDCEVHGEYIMFAADGFGNSSSYKDKLVLAEELVRKFTEDTEHV